MLLTRVITAVVLLGILLPTLFIAPYWIWQAVTLVFMALAGMEWGRMLSGKKGAVLLTVALLLAGVLFIVAPSTWEGNVKTLATTLIGFASLFWLLFVPFVLRPSFSARTGGLALAFVLLLATWLAVTQLRIVGPWYVLSCLLIVWIADTFAYFAGRAFGKTKLAPTISPGKTWAGAIGGAVGVVLYFVLATFSPVSIFPQIMTAFFGVVLTVLLAIIITAYSVMGDLFESKLKRETGVKDSGNTLPGHGGVFDRIDAVIAVLPLCWSLHRLASS